jgi:hypothetical protein
MAAPLFLNPDDQVDVLAWGMAESSSRRNLMKVSESLRVMVWVRTWPVWTFSAAMMDTAPWRTYSTALFGQVR